MPHHCWVNPDDARIIVLQYHEKAKVNYSWLADRIEVDRQTVWNWFNGKRTPSDPTVWQKMAHALGLDQRVNSALLETVRDFALDVLVATDDESLKAKAANLIREISKK